MDNFSSFWFEYAPIVNLLSAWTEVCKKCSSVIAFWRDQTFSIVWGVFLSVLQICRQSSAISFSIIDKNQNAMQLYSL